MLRHKCNTCGRDIGPDAPNGITCWTCYNKQNEFNVEIALEEAKIRHAEKESKQVEAVHRGAEYEAECGRLKAQGERVRAEYEAKYRRGKNKAEVVRRRAEIDAEDRQRRGKNKGENAETKSTRTISKICIVCGHENPDGSINCLKCGRNIDDNYEAYKGVYYGVYKYGEKNKGEKADLKCVKAEFEAIPRQERDKAEDKRRRTEVDAEDRRRRERDKRRRVEAERKRLEAEVETLHRQAEETGFKL